MASVNFTKALQEEYQRLFETCAIKEEKAADVEGILSRMRAAKGRYLTVAEELGVPWYFVGVIHNMEASLNFNCHLHNGDSLRNRTRNVPAGRPLNGEPPFSWEESAIDALQMKKLDTWTDWSVSGMLYKIEGYNGWGYRLYHPHVYSPYLWAGSNHYTSGKYVRDGTWSDAAVSGQIGAAALLRRMAEKNLVEFEDVPAVAQPPVLRYSLKYSASAEKLQKFMNDFPGVYLRPDGKAGEKTSETFRTLTGYYLQGDPRA